jgi:hypothetical protein
MEIYIIIFMAGLLIGILLRGEQQNLVSAPYPTNAHTGSNLVLYFIFFVLLIVLLFLVKGLI